MVEKSGTRFLCNYIKDDTRLIFYMPSQPSMPPFLYQKSQYVSVDEHLLLLQPIFKISFFILIYFFILAKPPLLMETFFTAQGQRSLTVAIYVLVINHRPYFLALLMLNPSFMKESLFLYNFTYLLIVPHYL